jgi:hypothetical protein
MWRRNVLMVATVLWLTCVMACPGSAIAQGPQASVTNAFSSASWLLHYTWDNVGSGQTIITFNSDGTFKTADGLQGRWFQRSADPRAVFAFSGKSGIPDWSVTCALTVAPDGGSFSGIQGWSATSGRPIGTHTAVRVRYSENPAALAPMLLMPQSAVDSVGLTTSGGSDQHKEK